MTKLSRAVIACISAIMILPGAAFIAGADTFTQYHGLLYLASSAALLIMFASAIGLAVWSAVTILRALRSMDRSR
jgi:hypothetical protein